MSKYNITLESPLQYIISENDSLEIMFMKAFLMLQMLKIFIFGMKVLSLYVIYNVVLRFGFKNLPNIKYIQFFVLLVAIEMAKHVIFDSTNEST